MLKVLRGTSPLFIERSPRPPTRDPRGVVVVVLDQNARPVGSRAHVQARQTLLCLWEHVKVTRVTVYTDIDEARAAAERLAEERG